MGQKIEISQLRPLWGSSYFLRRQEITLFQRNEGHENTLQILVIDYWLLKGTQLKGTKLSL